MRPAVALHLRALAPSFTIDGGTERAGRWGRNIVSVLPGPHTVEVWAGSKRRFGRSQLDVQVMPGCVTEVTWRPPLLGFGQGTMTIDVHLAVVDVRQPAGWYDDPTGKWDQRWWDGTDWTNHVQRNGTVVHDSE